MNLSHQLAVLVLFIAVSATAVAAPVDFVREVQPILKKHCYECHGGKKQKSGLRLDIKARAFKGGDTHGAAIVPNSARDSPLALLVISDNEDERMPFEKKPLSDEEITTLIMWITQGAVWPEGVDLAKPENKEDH